MGVPTSDDGSSTWLDTNRLLWDERVPAHVASSFYDLDGVVAGADQLRPWEDDELGRIEGLDVIHLQCHIGTDTVALARRGARVVGLDFSAPALEAAKTLAARCSLDIDWILSDVYEAVEATGGRTFDVVYTGVGALGWLPDLDPWARTTFDLVRPGGVLYVTEVHPMWVALIHDGHRVCQDAVHAGLTRWDSEAGGSYAAPERTFRHNTRWERLHGIGDLLTAVLDAGFAIELFHEHDATPAPTPWLERGTDGLWHFPDGMYRFPVMLSLRARRER